MVFFGTYTELVDREINLQQFSCPTIYEDNETEDGISYTSEPDDDNFRSTAPTLEDHRNQKFARPLTKTGSNEFLFHDGVQVKNAYNKDNADNVETALTLSLPNMINAFGRKTSFAYSSISVLDGKQKVHSTQSRGSVVSYFVKIWDTLLNKALGKNS